MPKVIIDTGDNLLYKSYYIFALEQRFGKKNICYSRTPFLELNNTDTRGIAFIITDGMNEKRIFIHANDSHKIIPQMYDWCDIYGHVNANIAMTEPRSRQKLIPLCPSFAVQCWSYYETAYHYLENLKHCGLSARKSLGQHYHQYIRAPYNYYTIPQNSSSRNVFFLSTLWYNDQWNHNDEQVNLSRAHFIRACKKNPDITFNGGFVLQTGNRSSVSLFADCISKNGEYSAKKWVDETKDSAIAFNTPAFLKCHGWKLGEYLAMGKAIISTNLFNDLP